MSGKIVLFLGSMRSSKTDRLLKVIDQAKYRNKKAILIRHSIDDRNFLVRNGDVHEAEIKLSKLTKCLKLHADIFCIDEGHFFSDLAPICQRLANNGKEVYITGLNGDSDMKEWQPISEIIPYADKIYRLSGVCEECHCDDATFTAYSGVKLHQTEVGDGKYRVLCRKCYNEAKQN